MCLVHITLIHWQFRYYSTYNTITVVFSVYQSKYSLFPKFCWIFFFVVSFRTFQTPETLKNILDSPNNRKKNYLHVLSMCLVHITLIHWQFRYYSTYNTITVVFSIYQSKYSLFPKFWWIFFFVVSFRTFQTPETLKNILDSPNNRKKNYLHVLSMCLVHITLIHWQFRYYSTYNTITVVFSIYQSKYSLFPKYILLCRVIQNILDTRNTEKYFRLA